MQKIFLIYKNPFTVINLHSIPFSIYFNIGGNYMEVGRSVGCKISKFPLQHFIKVFRDYNLLQSRGRYLLKMY